MNKKMRLLIFTVVIAFVVSLVGYNVDAKEVDQRITVSKKMISYEIPVNILGEYDLPQESQEIVINQVSGDDIGELSFIIEDSMKEYFSISCDDNNLGIDHPVTIKVKLQDAKKMAAYKIIENGLQIMSGDDCLAEIGLFYSIDVSDDIHAAEYYNFWKGQTLVDDGMKYAIVATINFDSLDVNAEYSLEFEIGYATDKNSQLVQMDNVDSLELNPDDIFIFSDGSYKKNIELNDGQRHVEFKLKIKESKYQEFIDAYNNGEIQAFDTFTLLTSLLINYTDGCVRGGKMATLPIATHNIFEDKVSLDQEELELSVDQGKILQATSFNNDLTWTSADPEIASVDLNGKVVGHNAGVTEIKVTNTNGKSAVCKVIVSNRPTIIENHNDLVSLEQTNIKKHKTVDTSDDINIAEMFVLMFLSLSGAVILMKKIHEKGINL